MEQSRLGDERKKWVLKLTDRTEYELTDRMAEGLAKELDDPSGADFVLFEIDGHEHRVKRTLIGVLEPKKDYWF